MKPRGRGRILFWPGGSLWIGRAEGATDFHFHHAIQITLALGARVRFREPGGDWQAYEAALVPTHRSHAMEAPGEEVALVFAEPESREARPIHLRCQGRGVAALEDEALASRRDSLARAYRAHAPEETLVAEARAVIRAVAGTAPPAEAPLDARIARAIEAIRGALDGPVSLADTARAAALSPDRFRHLFVEQTGLRFRSYVLWQRLERAVAEYAAGATLTDAAHAGGFADSAHFSRTFRRMFGMPAASLRIE